MTATGRASPDIEGATLELDPTGDGWKANVNNLLNIFGYALSLTAAYLIGVAGWFVGTPTVELFSVYQTLLTPRAATLDIWAVIFLLEGFFCLAQLLPRYRAQPLVQEGVGSVFFLAAIAQGTWTVTFGFEWMIPAFISMFALLTFLLVIVNRQWSVVQQVLTRKGASRSIDETTIEERGEELLAAQPPKLSYWHLRFPFAVHAGWTAVATPLMLNVVLVQEGVDAKYEMWLAVISLPLLFGGCMGLLLREEDGAPVYALPLVVAYGALGICWELHAPAYSILERHDEATITLMKNVSGFCGVCLLIVMISRFFALLLRDFYLKLRKKKEETLVIEGEEYQYAQA